MKLSYFSITVFLALCSMHATAQPTNTLIKDVVMPAPNAAALGKYSDIPVSYFTGVPSISIPIYTVQEGPLSVPVALNYHASGVRVGEPASWVGLGWSLDAGGMVTRTVMGKPDDQNGYYFTGASLTTTGNDISYAATGLIDSEPDIFSFNFAGYSGKFFFDKDQKVHFVPMQDLQLSVTTGVFGPNNSVGGFNSFVITTPEGNRYIFGNVPGATPVNAIEISQDWSLASVAASSWYLVRIETHDKKQAVNLAYVDENYSYKSPSTCRWVNYSVALSGGGQSGSYESCSGLADGGTNHYYVRMDMRGKRLAQITSSTSTVTFNADTDREDLDPFLGSGSSKARRLDNITVNSGSFCTRFQMTYDYFQDYVFAAQPQKSEAKRLQLTEVRESSCDNTATKPPYKITYEGNVIAGKIHLPYRFSNAIDHWGFYNGATHTQPPKYLNLKSRYSISAIALILRRRAAPIPKPMEL